MKMRRVAFIRPLKTLDEVGMHEAIIADVEFVDCEVLAEEGDYQTVRTPDGFVFEARK